MTYFKSIPYLSIIAILTFSACNDEAPRQSCDHVSVTIVNDLGIDIDEFLINGESFMLLEGEVSPEICFPEIMLDPNVPVIPFEARIGMENCQSMYQFFCGVGMIPIDSGEFKIRLTNWIISNQFPSCQINYVAE